jgi:transposase
VPATCEGGIDALLALVVRGFAGGVQPHHAYVFANRRADRLKVLVYDGVGMWLCTRRLQTGSFAWPREGGAGSVRLTREQFDWLVAGLPWQRVAQAPPQAITVI